MHNSIIKILIFLFLSTLILIPDNFYTDYSSNEIYAPSGNLVKIKQIYKNEISITPQNRILIISENKVKFSSVTKSIGKVEYIDSRKFKNVELSKTEKAANLSINDIYSTVIHKQTNYISDRYIRIYFDNDIFNNTDYYYTNGIKFELIDPILSYSPLMRFLLHYPGNSTNYFGINLVQNMYTPTNPDLGHIMSKDRPFASYLYLGHFKISNDAINKIRFTTELDIGIMGPGSLGGYFQNKIHDHEPLGWKHQVQNDILINYKVEIEKALLNLKNFEINGLANACLGTVYTNASIGFTSRLGKIGSYFEKLDITPHSKKNISGDKFRYYIFIKGLTNFIAYDATLQGGLTNNNNSYTINSKTIERSVFQASAGFVFAYKLFSLEYEQFFISPEFNTARPFFWGSLKTSFSF